MSHPQPDEQCRGLSLSLTLTLTTNTITNTIGAYHTASKTVNNANEVANIKY